MPPGSSEKNDKTNIYALIKNLKKLINKCIEILTRIQFFFFLQSFCHYLDHGTLLVKLEMIHKQHRIIRLLRDTCMRVF